MKNNNTNSDSIFLNVMQSVRAIYSRSILLIRDDNNAGHCEAGHSM